jgi:hypothetical protein
MRSFGAAFLLSRSRASHIVVTSLGVAVGLAVNALAVAAAGAEPKSSTEPDVLAEPAQVTDVVDALDVDGGIDLHFTLGYQHAYKRAAILRETQDPLVDPAAQSGITTVEVGDYSETVSRLNVRAELGLYHDLALVLRLPIVLSHRGTLESDTLAAGALNAAPSEPLFTLPFRSPNRSGVEWLGVGVDWGILNQWREASQPTLLIGAEGRFSVSEPMHACDTARCAYPSDIDRDGVSGEFEAELEPGVVESLEGNFPTQARRAGVSRGTTVLELHSWISRRFRHLEPYAGASLALEFANDNSDFGGDRAWNDGPPTRGSFSFGTEFMPWEAAEQFQRLSLDVRFTGSYRSAGEDYSELFDALGSAAATSYRLPNFAGYRNNPDPNTSAEFPSVVDPRSERVFPTGITRVQAHGTYGFRLAGRWQAGRYVHFDVGGALALAERHALTTSAQCDPARAVSAGEAGPCQVRDSSGVRVLGAYNPRFRPEIDLPGRRFIVGTATTIDAWVSATVMF